MKNKDTYKEVKTMRFSNMVVNIHIPDLTEDERSRRMKTIHKAAENLMKAVAV